MHNTSCYSCGKDFKELAGFTCIYLAIMRVHNNSCSTQISYRISAMFVNTFLSDRSSSFTHKKHKYFLGNSHHIEYLLYL